MGCFLSSAKGIPHYRIKTDSRPHNDAPDFNPVFDLTNDYEQQNPVKNKELEHKFAAIIRQKLIEYDAPECQVTRLNL
jgi:hypothetical protein